ncbi:hypothetical protein [Senegalia massiliensis]|uniref:hypothetical protein n=1 Tax=Senegalia massiliensis TaxID=1720316 RepID=UPI001030A32C|nr:hypothetical protein [Senegalia massiliensis]
MNDYNNLLDILMNQIDSIQSNNKHLENQSCNSHKFSNSTSIEDCFFSLGPNEFTALATILGFITANRLNINQQNSLGSFLQLVGQTILTISAQSSTLESDNNNSDISEQLESIKKQIQLIEKKL